MSPEIVDTGVICPHCKRTSRKKAEWPQIVASIIITNIRSKLFGPPPIGPGDDDYGRDRAPNEEVEALYCPGCGLQFHLLPTRPNAKNEIIEARRQAWEQARENRSAQKFDPEGLERARRALERAGITPLDPSIFSRAPIERKPGVRRSPKRRRKLR